MKSLAPGCAGAGVRFAVAALVTTVASGCVSVRPVENSSAFSLASGEGILVVDIGSAIPIEKMSFSQVPAIQNLPAGEHFLLLAVTAGSYRWNEIVIPATEGVVPFSMARHDVWRFRVEAGRISYPGHYEFGGKTEKRRVEISVSMENRSAQALRRLRERFPELLQRYPPVYTGSTRDDFLDYYARTFGASASPSAETSSR